MLPSFRRVRLASNHSVLAAAAEVSLSFWQLTAGGVLLSVVTLMDGEGILAAQLLFEMAL